MRSLQNLQKSFEQMRLLVIIFFVIGVFAIGFTISKAFSFADKQMDKIYVLDNGNSLLLALSKDMNENRPVEARSHVISFHKLFFNLDPDPKAIDDNIKKSLNFADESARTGYINMLEKGYFKQIVAANISQRVEVDSVKVEFSSYPYYVRFYGRETLTRTTSVTLRRLITECYLRNVTRTDNNPHGFLMERWQVLNNDDLETKPRL